MNITFILADQTEKNVAASAGETLLDVTQNNDIPIFSACAGVGVCGSCVVKLDPTRANQVPPPQEQELDVLDMFQHDEAVRLACQLTLTDECDNLRVILI
ncbi:hypothetical protein AGMMS49949_09000 [Alphaproteobacteria bacterium]|nr:hypothetical protein AGMMS49949_09000 [Alphaproteobacteria bacterium]GHS98336.1 hypothetical protein AGMMS50296_5940 [Alphaproteobacteria bacterium]